MPICADPSETFPVHLKLDEGKPDPKPTFLARFITQRQRRKVISLTDAASAKGVSFDDAATALDEALAILVVGRKNVVFQGEPVADDVPFGDFLTLDEVWELLYACLSQGRATEEQRKNSGSPPASPAASSAETAPSDDAPASA